ncbi:MAG TPA: NHL repeat-containing protein [Blastocatellia bacterium]|nr:NHL repeat-containing protein [Blastocatellia bacterium]
MRRILISLVILLVPALACVALYFVIKPGKKPTRPDAIGSVRTLAGSGAPGVMDGEAGSARFDDPFGVALDRKGNVIVSDGGNSNRIRAITPTGLVGTIAGSIEGFGDGRLENAAFNTPSGIAVDRRGNIFICDTSNNRIRKLDVDGNVSTIAGSGVAGLQDGGASEARFDGPIGIAIAADGTIVVADTYNDSIRRIDSEGQVTTVAGSGKPGFVDGASGAALFDTPCGVAVDGAGNIFVADTANDAIRKITPAGEVSTFAGGLHGRNDGIGTEAEFNQPTGIAITHDGFLFVTDAASGRFRRISPEGHDTTYAGAGAGFGNGIGSDARFNGPAGIAVDREGNLFVADARNYLIRKIAPGSASATEPPSEELFVQPPARHRSSDPIPVIPRISETLDDIGPSLNWPLNPQEGWHEVTGLAGEARGAPGGIALHHLHSGLDIRGGAGEPVLSIVDEKVSSPLASWEYGGSSEGIQVGLMSYIHIRVGRDKDDNIQERAKFKVRVDESGAIVGVRPRRGARFRVGESLGCVNSLYHVHLNFGPWGAQANPLQFSFPGLKDTIPPVIEPNGIEVISSSGQLLTEVKDGRLVISGDVDIVVTAYDKFDGNNERRKLGLYKVGYQLMKEDGTPAPGFEQPLINIEFNRLPPDDADVFVAYLAGSGVSAYGGETRFKYIVTNLVRDGLGVDGTLRTSGLPPGNYTLRILAEDYAGNRAGGKEIELQIAIVGR